MSDLLKGSIILLDIKKIGINGEGIGYYNKLAVFVKGAITKERIYAKVEEVHDKYLVASISSIIEPSNRRVEPMCKFYEQCGACNLQHIKLNEQMKIKGDLVKNALRKYTKFDVDKLDIRKTVESDTLSFRNKSQMPFKDTSFGLSLGLFQEGSNKFIYVDNCFVQDEHVNEINNEVLSILRKYDMKTTKSGGVVEYLCTRYLDSTKESQVTFIVSKYVDELKQIAKEVKEKIKSLKTVAYSISNKNSPAIFGDEVVVLEGVNYINDDMLGLKVSLSPKSFYQLNRGQALKMYQEILDMEYNENDVVVDCYSGIGVLGMLLSKKVKHVYSIDLNNDSIKNARIIARANDISNVTFYSDRIEHRLPELIKDGITINKVILDPPRSGLQDSVIDSLIKSLPERIVYVSCNASTLAKDLNKLSNHYKIEYIRPYDFFCETALVESVCCLVRK